MLVKIFVIQIFLHAVAGIIVVERGSSVQVEFVLNVIVEIDSLTDTSAVIVIDFLIQHAHIAVITESGGQVQV